MDESKHPPKETTRSLPSRHVLKGPERAPNRSYLYAMGLTAEELAERVITGEFLP